MVYSGSNTGKGLSRASRLAAERRAAALKAAEAPVDATTDVVVSTPAPAKKTVAEIRAESAKRMRDARITPLTEAAAKSTGPAKPKKRKVIVPAKPAAKVTALSQPALSLGALAIRAMAESRSSV